MAQSNQARVLSKGAKLKNNQYRIENLINQGGSGSVYLATDLSDNRPCAIKESRNAAPDTQDQFKREANILVSLSHPNLPRVTDFFTRGKTLYLVMDFVEGEDLQQIIDRVNGPLPVALVMAWIRQVCDALTYLHTRVLPIIHRDVKPANIRVTPTGQVKLVDFGISKIYVQGRPTSSAISKRGTEGYSPPEQYAGGTDMRSDVYALGATLYALLTGVEPPDSAALAAGWQHLVSPRQHNPILPATIEAVVLKAMEVKRDLRYDTIEALWKDLRRAVAPPSVVPTNVSPAQKQLGALLRMQRALQSHDLARIAATYRPELDKAYATFNGAEQALLEAALRAYPWLA